MGYWDSRDGSGVGEQRGVTRGARPFHDADGALTAFGDDDDRRRLTPEGGDVHVDRHVRRQRVGAEAGLETELGRDGPERGGLGGEDLDRGGWAGQHRPRLVCEIGLGVVRLRELDVEVGRRRRGSRRGDHGHARGADRRRAVGALVEVERGAADRYDSAYGVIGAFIAIMLWAYYASTVLFFGAEFVRTISEEERLAKASK